MARADVSNQKPVPVPWSHPYRGVGPDGTSLASSMKPVWDQFGTGSGSEIENPTQPAKMGTDPVSKAAELVKKVGS